MTVYPATMVDILGQCELARGYGVASAVSGPMGVLILPVAGSLNIIFSFIFLCMMEMMEWCMK